MSGDAECEKFTGLHRYCASECATVDRRGEAEGVVTVPPVTITLFTDYERYGERRVSAAQAGAITLSIEHVSTATECKALCDALEECSSFDHCAPRTTEDTTPNCRLYKQGVVAYDICSTATPDCPASRCAHYQAKYFAVESKAPTQT